MEKPTLIDIQGIGKAAADRLTAAGYITIDDVARADAVQLSTVSGFSDGRAERTIAAAKELIGSDDLSHASAAPSAAPGEAASSDPHPMKSEVINMTTDNTEITTTPPATAQTAAPKAEPVKPETAKAAPKAATKVKAVKAKAKAPAKKPVAKKADSKPSVTLKAKPKAAPKTGPKAEPKAEPKTQAKAPATAPAAVATPKPPAPANTNKPSIFKEPGYVAAGVVLLLAAYGFAQQPGVQTYFGFANSDTTSTTTAALTTPASDAAPTSAASAATTPPASTAPNMPTYMQRAMTPGAMPGNGVGMPQQNPSAFAPVPNQYGTPQYNGPQYGGPQYGGPVGIPQNPKTQAPQQTQAAAPQASGEKARPMPSFGPYSHPGYGSYGNGNGYGQGYGQGYGNGNGYGQGNGNFNMNFASRANSRMNTGAYTGVYGNGYNGYNGPAPYGYGPQPYPMPRAMMQPIAPPQPLSK